ncbi:4'-phosphopantetheinyl transferase family protein [Pseudonocardia lacus]|uniref:4'-phosphopantetheinyl transferase family protein n=1 Tax=Pseudonocardia lacus TaxID=2835865 RepID=UPI001BDC1DE8|nr:4'-phosphopantetheinyl transferase superfamily protein [Pseudonocardia lacus]
MSGTCEIRWARPVDPDTAAHLVVLLDDTERARLPRFRLPADRARYLAAHALTRLVLADAVGADPAELRFDRTCRCGEQHGKPVLPGGPGFSLTHAGDVVGVAVHSGPVGLDVERARPLSDITAMAAHVRSPGEAVADEAAFFTLWTRKEALLKATGEGLSAPMSDITLGPDGVLGWVGAGAPTQPVWLRDLRPAPGYAGAVAGLGPDPLAVRESDGDDLLRAP